LSVLQWYQKQAGLVGFFLIPRRGLSFYVSRWGDACQAWSPPETESPLTSSAPGLI
jgi:hypothetical protein